jgi:hypothetical protein
LPIGFRQNVPKSEREGCDVARKAKEKARRLHSANPFKGKNLKKFKKKILNKN